jgi:hypothetical protein
LAAAQLRVEAEKECFPAVRDSKRAGSRPGEPGFHGRDRRRYFEWLKCNHCRQKKIQVLDAGIRVFEVYEKAFAFSLFQDQSGVLPRVGAS